MTASLAAIVAADLARPLRADAAAMAHEIAARHGDAVAAVLFYGAGLRIESDPTAILDLYVLVDDERAVFRNALSATACRVLPPNVLFLPSNAPDNAGFKVAVISRRAFRARLAPESRDTTLWARFCQPARLAWARDDAARVWAEDACAAAAATALHWAARLGPETGTAQDYWRALFRATYAAELRVEGGGRADAIVGWAEDRYAALLAAGDAFAPEDGIYRRRASAAEADRAQAAWARRRRWGKALNAARLIKAAFTFAGGGDYIAAKLARHAGQPVELGPWQRRHPLLAAPFVLAALRRKGIVR